MNQNLEERDGERHQTLSASTVLSQEWENIINGSRLAVDPTQVTQKHAQHENVGKQSWLQHIYACTSQK